MADRPLRVVPYRPDPRRHTVIDCRPGHEGPYLQGDGDDDSVCGACGFTLIRGRLVAFLTLFLCCPSCGKYNVAGDAA